MQGVIKTIVEKGSYGFIKTMEGTEYFFHKQDYLGHWDDLIEDKNRGLVTVDFDVVKSPKGPRAANVQRTSEMMK